MKKNPEKVTLKFRKKTKEFVCTYPEYTNRNGKITARFFSTLYEMAEKEAQKLGYKDLKSYFNAGGFDIETFTMSINAKNGQTQNIRCDGKLFS